MRRTAQYFNLVELVIIITVLVGIASLFLPVLYDTTINARSVLCKANQQTLGTWINMYGAKNGTLPGYQGWVQATASMDGRTVSQSNAPEDELACPSQVFLSYDNELQPEVYWRGSNYGINQHITSPLTDTWGEYYPEWRLSAHKGIRDPSSTVALADSSGSNFFRISERDPTISGISRDGGTYADALPPNPPLGSPFARHANGTANFLYVDGHSEPLGNWPVFMRGPGTSGRAFWHGDHRDSARTDDAEADK
jgi:prepilin-type processing-associated H-X9-DG protein